MYNAVVSAPFGKVGIGVDAAAGCVRAIVYLEDSVGVMAPDSALAERAARQIERYLANAAAPFELPLADVGTPFQRRVWQAMCEIPRGSVLTYGALCFFPRQPGESWADALAHQPATLPSFSLPQAEALAVTPDGAEIYVSVDSNLQVDLYVQHAPEENRAEPLVYLGHNPLKKAGGVHVRDTLVFENKPLGLHYLYEIPFGQPGEHRQIVKDFKKGTFEPVVEPKSLTDLHLFIHGQEVGRYPGPKMELVEGKHTLEIRGGQLTRSAQFEIEVKPGGNTRKLLQLSDFVQK